MERDMRAGLQDALEDACDVFSSMGRRADGFSVIEHLLAVITLCTNEISMDKKTMFLYLQNEFECNVVARMLVWISHEVVLLKSNQLSIPADEQIRQLTRALNICQGLCLIHPRSKVYLGRKKPLQALLDTFTVSRSLMRSNENCASDRTSAPFSTISSALSAAASPLATAALETLLCILVDSSIALRAFEEVNGVGTIVRTLKRTGVERDVRIKCLEFLYFYLMDETTEVPQLADVSHLEAVNVETLPPSSPTKPSNSNILSSPSKRHSKSTSWSSSSQGSSRTNKITMATRSGMKDLPFERGVITPSPSPPPPSRHRRGASQGQLLMLRQDVDFTPSTPKKPFHPAIRDHSLTPALPLTPSGDILRSERRKRSGASGATPLRKTLTESIFASTSRLTPSASTGLTRSRTEPDENASTISSDHRNGKRTTAEKKVILGQLLGNVDKLVESVQQAGVFGLG